VHKDSITIRLRLPGLMVLGVEEWERCIELVARYSSEEGVCPRCGRRTWQVHQWRQQRKWSGPKLVPSAPSYSRTWRAPQR
jgi:transposase